MLVKSCHVFWIKLIMAQIAKAVDEEVISRDLVPAFIKLLKDTEAEVRSAIAGQIPGKLMTGCRKR